MEASVIAEIRHLYNEGHSLSQIAAKTNVALTSVKAALYRRPGSERGSHQYTRNNIFAQFQEAFRLLWKWHPENAERRRDLINKLADQPSWPELEARIRRRAGDRSYRPL
jgi:hypothetical protein